MFTISLFLSLFCLNCQESLTHIDKLPASNIVLVNNDERKLAETYCKQEYKKLYSGVKMSKNGNFKCLFKKTAQQMRKEAEAECKQRFSKDYRDVELKGSHYRCVYKKTDERLKKEAENLCRKKLGNRYASVSFPLAKDGIFSRVICEYKK